MKKEKNFSEKKCNTLLISHSTVRYEYVEIDGECCCFAEDVFKGLKLENTDIEYFKEALINVCSIAVNVFDLHISTISYIERRKNEKIQMLSPTGIAMVVLFAIKIAQLKIMTSTVSVDEIHDFEEMCQSLDKRFYSFIKTNEGEIILSSKLEAILCTALNEKIMFMSFLKNENAFNYSFVSALATRLLPFCISYNSDQKKSFWGKLFGSKTKVY